MLRSAFVCVARRQSLASREWIKANQGGLNALKRDWYQRNRETHQGRVLARRMALRKWLREYKSTLRCERCGENHAACLDFHHREPGEKEVMVSKLVDHCGWGMARILAEIEKCTVLCAHCHRKEHWTEDEP